MVYIQAMYASYPVLWIGNSDMIFFHAAHFEASDVGCQQEYKILRLNRSLQYVGIVGRRSERGTRLYG